jgi:hypothetical protein
MEDYHGTALVMGFLVFKACVECNKFLIWLQCELFYKSNRLSLVHSGIYSNYFKAMSYHTNRWRAHSCHPPLLCQLFLSSTGVKSSRIHKISTPCILSPLMYIFNKVLYLGIFPDRMKFSIIKPLHKKGTTKEFENYRSISLLTVFFLNLRENHL